MHSKLPANVNNLPDVRLALNLIGIDAPLKDVQDFVTLFSNAVISQQDVDYVRSELHDKEREQGKRYYTKADRLGQVAEILLRTEEGRKAFRWAMKRVRHDDLMALLGFASDDNEGRPL